MIFMARATGPTYNVPFKRRYKNKTDYRKRLGLIKSGLPRLVVRASNGGVLVQIVSFDEKGDKTIAQAKSQELSKFGWLGQANTPSAYLTGLLAAKRAVSAGVKDSILDMGMVTASKGKIHFAAAMGAKDAGLNINIDDSLVDKTRINGTHISEYAKKLDESEKEKYQKLFSRYISKKIDPKNLPVLFEEVKGKISKGE